VVRPLPYVDGRAVKPFFSPSVLFLLISANTQLTKSQEVQHEEHLWVFSRPLQYECLCITIISDPSDCESGVVRAL